MKNTINSSKSQKTSFISGFTLIEMLVVIAIIAILSGIIIANLSGAKGKARDAKRISDLGNIQMALGLYFDRCDMYPYQSGGVLTNGGTANDCLRKKPDGTFYQMTDFIASIPKPSTEAGPDHYFYFSTNDKTLPDYFLEAVLENPSVVVKDGLNDSSSGNTMPSWTGYVDHSAGYYTYLCSNLSTSKNYCIGPK